MQTLVLAWTFVFKAIWVAGQARAYAKLGGIFTLWKLHQMPVRREISWKTIPIKTFNSTFYFGLTSYACVCERVEVEGGNLVN